MAYGAACAAACAITSFLEPVPYKTDEGSNIAAATESCSNGERGIFTVGRLVVYGCTSGKRI